MKIDPLNLLRCAGAAALVGLSGTAFAQVPYPDVGTPNPTTYAFTAAATGDIVGYFAGSTASFNEEVGLIADGVPTGGFGLDDHSSSIGQSFDFGPVTAGETLVFEDYVFNESEGVYSDPSMNIAYDSIDGGGGVANHNHIYSVAVTAGEVYSGSPAGTYVAFEDLPFPGSDYNYFDDTFIFTNVATVTHGLPDVSSTFVLAALAIAAVGAVRFGFRRAAAR